MSRAACSVEKSGSRAPYFAPHPSPTRLLIATTSSNSACVSGSGSAPNVASRSASEMHSTGDDRETPRGSKPTMSKRSVISSGSPPNAAPNDRYTAVLMPEPPGPPGLTTSEPIRSPWRVERARSSATSNVPLPLGAAQSCGTATLVHSYRMPGAVRPTRSSGTSGQGRQVEASPDAAGPGGDGFPSPAPSVFGAYTGSVQPAARRAPATRPVKTRRWVRATRLGYPPAAEHLVDVEAHGPLE